MARIGKIARLPVEIREELNRRLRGGQLGPQVLPWLNGLPEVQSVLNEFFEGQKVNAQNLSDWRQGGFKEWEEKQDRTYRVRELAAFAAKLAEANGGSIAEGAATIASGKILELLEAADGTAPADMDQLGDIVSALTGLRGAEIAQQRANIDREKLKRKDEELALEREKFQRDTCEMFIKWSQDQRALQVANAPLSNEQKLNDLGKLMFGELWDRSKETAAKA